MGRNIQLTEDGHTLLHKVEDMLKQVKRFEGSVREIAHRHNRLQIALPSQIATIILPLLLGEFHQLHPEVELEITEPSGSEALDMVEREEVDLAFVHDADDRSTLTLRKLSAWPICLCVPEGHELTSQKNITLAKAASYPLVLLGRNFILTHEIFEKCQKQKLTPQVLHYSPHLSTIWNIVRQGIAFSILTSNGIPPESGLAAIPIKGMSQRGFVVIKKGRQIYSGERLLAVISFFPTIPQSSSRWHHRDRQLPRFPELRAYTSALHCKKELSRGHETIFSAFLIHNLHRHQIHLVATALSP